MVTFAGLYLMAVAQPALLYLVPFTLIPVFLLGLCRREFSILWNGDGQVWIFQPTNSDVMKIFNLFLLVFFSTGCREYKINRQLQLGMRPTKSRSGKGIAIRKIFNHQRSRRFDGLAVSVDWHTVLVTTIKTKKICSTFWLSVCLFFFIIIIISQLFLKNPKWLKKRKTEKKVKIRIHRWFSPFRGLPSSAHTFPLSISPHSIFLRYLKNLFTSRRVHLFKKDFKQKVGAITLFKNSLAQQMSLVGPVKRLKLAVEEGDCLSLNAISILTHTHKKIEFVVYFIHLIISHLFSAATIALSIYIVDVPCVVVLRDGAM